MASHFEVAVIGGGIMGAPAARELAERGHRVVAIASPEPETPSEHDGPFGAHYDVTRLTWIQHADPVETDLSLRAMELLQARHGETGDILMGDGCLFVAAPGHDEGRLAAATDQHIRDAGALMTEYPSLSLPADVRGFDDPLTPGLMDPRATVAQDLRAAARAGATVLATEAVEVCVNGSVSVTLRSGETITADQAVVATGAFTGRPGLLERPPALRFKEESVLLVEVDDERAEQLADYPPLVYQLAAREISDVYSSPAVRYPDGTRYLKWGANTLADRWITSYEDLGAWYRNGDSRSGAALIMPFAEMTIPALAGAPWTSMRCAVTYTPHGKPYLDELVPGRLFIGVGGNGHSAKWSPILGRLLADLVDGIEWDTAIPREQFRVQFDASEWTIRDLWSDRAP